MLYHNKQILKFILRKKEKEKGLLKSLFLCNFSRASEPARHTHTH